jgi:hypothetical protein
LSFLGLVDFDGRKNGLSADGAVWNCRGAVGADDKVPEIKVKLWEIKGN